MSNITDTSKSLIPFFGVKRQYQNIANEIIDASHDVYMSGNVLDGPYTKAFEQEIARRTDRQFAISVNSGTQALIFAIRAINRHNRTSSRKIVIPAQSFVATLNSVMMANDTPIICDVHDNSGLINISKIPDRSTESYDAVMFVNLYGNIVNYDELCTRTKLFDQIMLIEDAAQSFGGAWRNLPSGKLGDISILSFDPTKNLNNYGSGGMILTDDLLFANMFANVKDNGKPNGHDQIGTNSKMSEVDCAQMLVKLGHFDAWQRRRTEIANYFSSNLPETMVISIDPRVTHAWSKYAIQCADRKDLMVYLAQDGIETRIHYQKSLNHYDKLVRPTVLDGEEIFAATTLSLPIYPELTDGEVEHIVNSINRWYRSYRQLGYS